MSDYVIVNGELRSCDELNHHGIKGMRWGIRRFQKKDGSLTPAGKKRRLTDMGTELSRKTSKRDDPNERKKRIDADIKEADDRVKFYGSKRAAKTAISEEARYAKNVNRGKAAINTLKFGGSGALAGGTLMALAANTAAAAAVGAAAPLLGVGIVSAAAATKANSFINRHSKEQLRYTDESEYGHDMVVTFKKTDN